MSRDNYSYVIFMFFAVVLLLLFIFPSAFALDDLMALQGNVKQNGVNLVSGNLTVVVFDAYSGGNIVYNSSADFNNSIVDGKYDVMLGNGSRELNLEFGRLYYLELYVNNEKFTFNGATRQIFQSSTGQINGSMISPYQINNTLIASRAINATQLILNIDLSNATNLRASAVNKTTGASYLSLLLDSIIDSLSGRIDSVNTSI